MGIFTTQLTRVVPVTIKPEKLKVKGLSKEAKTRQLDQEDDHNDGHESHSIIQQYAQEHFQQNQSPEEKNSGNHSSSQQPNKSNEDDSDEPSHHLDIFV